MCDVFENSDIDISGIDYDELGLYLAINMTEQQIIELGLHNKKIYERTKAYHNWLWTES